MGNTWLFAQRLDVLTINLPPLAVVVFDGRAGVLRHLPFQLVISKFYPLFEGIEIPKWQFLSHFDKLLYTGSIVRPTADKRTRIFAELLPQFFSSRQRFRNNPPCDDRFDSVHNDRLKIKNCIYASQKPHTCQLKRKSLVDAMSARDYLIFRSVSGFYESPYCPSEFP